MPRIFSLKRIVSVLQENGFLFVSQKGSHAKYRKAGKTTLTAIVPVGKKEIPYGTFRSILRQSGLKEDDF
ncbi:hypothetical protein BWK69_00780 [Candidatus Parcubacteria bacterium A4]|nr:MAG: hypothetical protein BWK69_00780 [Candidatus Parcubacteria bacterium A4]